MMVYVGKVLRTALHQAFVSFCFADDLLTRLFRGRYVKRRKPEHSRPAFTSLLRQTQAEKSPRGRSGDIDSEGSAPSPWK